MKYGAIASRAFFKTKFLQLFLDKLFLQSSQAGLNADQRKKGR